MPLFEHSRMVSEIMAGATSDARETLRRLEACCDPERGTDRFHLEWARLEYRMCCDVTTAPLEQCRQALAAAESSGMIYVMVRARHTLCWATALTCGHEEVLAEIEALRALIGGGFAYYQPSLDLVEAWSLLKSDRLPEAQTALRRAFAGARQGGAPLHNGVPAPFFLQRLCAEALSAGIEVDHVRDLVRQFRYAPPSLNVEAWPWPLRINVLGRFEIRRDDVPLTFPGKTPRKPLALLKLMAAASPEGVTEQKVLDALWPDEDGDAARNALGVALVRLRKLLGTPEAVQLKDQCLSLNSRCCWVDAWAFEQFARSVEGRLGTGDAGQLLALADRATALYRGDLLPADPDEPWAMQARLKLRVRFVRLIETLGGVLEQAGQWNRALDCYYRGLDADDLVEEFYVGLMRCYGALGRPADGIAVFRRLRQTLSVVLNIPPSPAAEVMARSLRADPPGN